MPPLSRLPIWTLLCVAAMWFGLPPTAYGQISAISSRSVKPNATTTLTIQGSGFDDSLRILPHSKQVTATLRSIEPTQAIVDLTLPADHPFGPLGLWCASAAGPLTPQMLIVDDLEPVQDNNANHSPQEAQPVPTLSAISGVADTAKSDYFRIEVGEGERIAFEMHTQALHSAMDPVLRILDPQGNSIRLADDGPSGPDFRFSHTFATAGQYLIQIHDNRFTGGGAYYLRIGDFPIISHSHSLAIEQGQNTTLAFVASDQSNPESVDLVIDPQQTTDPVQVATRRPDGKSSAWFPVMIRSFHQVVEARMEGADEPEPLEIPSGISGQLSQQGEVDTYAIRGVKDQSIEVIAKTRSIGCPTLLTMELFDASGAKVAETKVAEADEWSFNYAFPAAGLYQLKVTDLLQRGGLEFGYYVGIQPTTPFKVALKPDKATKRQFALQGEHGACAIDLVIDRTRYEGAIDITVVEETESLRILNPRIPAKAKEQRIYLVAQSDWNPASIAALRLQATAVDDGELVAVVSSDALQRLLEPFVLSPAPWQRHAIQFAGVTNQDPQFQITPAKPLQMARSLPQQTVTFALQHSNPKSKVSLAPLPEGVSLDSAPTLWRSSGKLDKETLSVTFSRADATNPEPEQISIAVYSEHQGRGRIDSLPFPVEWIDPLRIDLQLLGPLIVGKPTQIRAEITRGGNDPQEVVLKPVDLPTGVTIPESVSVAADQTVIEFPVTISADADPALVGQLKMDASTKYYGNELSIQATPLLLKPVAMPVKLTVFPPQIELHSHLDRQQVVVTGYDQADRPRDWTADVEIVIANPEIASIQAGTIHPKANGETELSCEIGGVRQVVPVIVSNFETPVPTAFESDVLVALSKQGCNSGACHGSPSGKGGFRLSLRAFDSELDELTLIRESFGRRVNVLEPEKSLLLQKPTMQVSHGGGKKLKQDDDAYEVLRRWIAEGAQSDPEGTPRCVELVVFPNEKRVLALTAGGQQLAVTARFTDQSQRDVTNMVAYSSSNTSVATVDEHGFVTPHEQGEAVILARYLEHIESLPLMFVDNDPDFQWEPQPVHNYIDEAVDAKLKLLQYQPAPLCDDPEFVRRVYLDVIGVLPTVEESKQFLADPNPEKRSQLIDRLLERPEYAKFWALKWGDLLRMTGAMVGDSGVFKYHRWVEESIRENMPYDRFATALVTASGSTLANPPANFYRTSTDMNESVETISQVFLGARLQCAKCHNHPFERWTQDNYYGLGAFFNRVDRRKTPRPGEMLVFVTDSGEVTQPRTGQIMEPWLPSMGPVSGQDLAADNAETVAADNVSDDDSSDGDRRTRFAQWLTDPRNPYFARIEANRIWSQLFSRGIVDPIDDFRDSNPPSNAPLLDSLANDFVESGFDRKHLLRTILNSRTYQASFATNASNESDELYFSHQSPRLLGAEQLLDAINQTLGLQEKFANLPLGTNATQLPAPDIAKVDFLKVFGQPDRLTVCACERIEDSNLGMAIELFNGTELHHKLHDKNNRFHLDLVAGIAPEEIIRKLYFAAICRPPTSAELTAAMQHCESRGDMASGIEDVCWALFNTDEFVFQH